MTNEANGTRSWYSKSALRQTSTLSGSVRTETGTEATDRQPCLLWLPCRGSTPVFNKDAALICRPAPGAIRCAASQHCKSDSILFFYAGYSGSVTIPSLLAISTGCDKGIICRMRREIITLSSASGRDDIGKCTQFGCTCIAGGNWLECATIMRMDKKKPRRGKRISLSSIKLRYVNLLNIKYIFMLQFFSITCNIWCFLIIQENENGH